MPSAKSLMVGSVGRYDFQSAGGDIPKLALPAMEPFFRHAMQLNGRRITRSEKGLSVATPEAWPTAGSAP